MELVGLPNAKSIHRKSGRYSEWEIGEFSEPAEVLADLNHKMVLSQHLPVFLTPALNPAGAIPGCSLLFINDR